jgi:hypothetical protein
MTHATLSWQSLYVRLKKLLASIKGNESFWVDIAADHTLRGHVGLTEQRLGTLSTRINNDFADVHVLVTPTEVRAAVFVRDLAKLIIGKAS